MSFLSFKGAAPCLNPPDADRFLNEAYFSSIILSFVFFTVNKKPVHKCRIHRFFTIFLLSCFLLFPPRFFRIPKPGTVVINQGRVAVIRNAAFFYCSISRKPGVIYSLPAASTQSASAPQLSARICPSSRGSRNSAVDRASARPESRHTTVTLRQSVPGMLVAGSMM